MEAFGLNAIMADPRKNVMDVFARYGHGVRIPGHDL